MSDINLEITESTPINLEITTSGPAGANGQVQSIVAGTNVTVDDTDPANPIVSSTGGGGGGTPGGSNTQVQFNDSGSFGGDSALTFDKTTDSLKVNGGTGAGSTLEVNGTTDTLYLSMQGTQTIDNNRNATLNSINVDGVAGIDSSGNISGANLSGTNTGDQTLSGLGGVPTSRTINGQDLSANRTLTQDNIGDGTTYKQYSATEKTKLAGIEALADVTDATNVDAAGATMNSDTTLAGNGYFLDEDDMVSDSAVKVPSQQSVKAYSMKKMPRGVSKYDGASVRDYCIPGSIGAIGVAASAPSTNRWIFEPLIITEPTTFDRVAMEITTAGAAGKLARIALYTADQYWQPATLIQDFGTIAIDVGAVPTLATITINTTLQPGRYIAVWITDGAATYRSITTYLRESGINPAGSTTPLRYSFQSLNGSGTVASGFAAVNPKWERDLYSSVGSFSYYLRWREAV